MKSMKKITLVLGCLLSISLSYAQQQTTSAYGAGGKVMTAEEANKLNGTPQTTINGKPYSQYKAEQEALKQKSAFATNQKYGSVLGATTNWPAAKPEQKSGKPETMPLQETKPVVTDLAKEPVAEKTAETSTFDPWAISHLGNGQIIAKEQEKPVEPNSFLGMQASGQKPVIQKKTPGRTAEEIEKAKQAEADYIKVDPNKQPTKEAVKPVLTAPGFNRTDNGSATVNTVGGTTEAPKQLKPTADKQ
jgi:hypothetical protein